MPKGRVAISESNPQSDESEQQMRKYVLIGLVAVAPLAFSDTATAGSCGFLRLLRLRLRSTAPLWIRLRKAALPWRAGLRLARTGRRRPQGGMASTRLIMAA